MKKLIRFVKYIFIFVFIIFFWYFSLFRNLEIHNIGKVLNLFSSNNNFDSSVFSLNENGEADINANLISISLSSNKLSELVIHLFNDEDDVIDVINYNDCILRNKSTCTYLVDDSIVHKIKVVNYDNKKLRINNIKYINQVRDYIFNKLLLSLIFVILIVIFFKLSIKYSFENKMNEKFKNIGINKAFVIIASLIGVITSILIPLYQVPDEQTHINMIYNERNIKEKFPYSVSSNNFVGTEDIIKDPSKKVDVSKYFAFNNKIEVENSFNIPQISLIRHFPQCIGMIIGELLKLPLFIYITLCELCALAFYIFICNIALKKIPIKKNLMMMIMLLPVAIQQMASFSYDVVLNSFCFLFIAYILDLKYNNKKIDNFILLKLLFILFVIAVCKIPYIIVGLLIFILPIENVKLSFFKKEITYETIKEKVRKHKLVSLIIFLLLTIIFFVALIKVLLKIDIGRILIASILNLKATAILYIKTLRLSLSFYFDTISGNLGWFDTRFSMLFQIYVYFSLFIFIFIGDKDIDDKNNVLKVRDKVIFYIVACLLIYIIILSMFGWTLTCSGVQNVDKLSVDEYANYFKTLPFIGGVQGRYFIPVIPILLIPVNSKRIREMVDKLGPVLYQMFYYLILFVVMIYVLLFRYWI